LYPVSENPLSSHVTPGELWSGQWRTWRTISRYSSHGEEVCREVESCYFSKLLLDCHQGCSRVGL
jgi:hypothetical protein